MSSQAPTVSDPAAFVGQIPPVEPLLAEVIATLALAAHAYVAQDGGKEPVSPTGVCEEARVMNHRAFSDGRRS